MSWWRKGLLELLPFFIERGWEANHEFSNVPRTHLTSRRSWPLASNNTVKQRSTYGSLSQTSWQEALPALLFQIFISFTSSIFKTTKLTKRWSYLAFGSGRNRHANMALTMRNQIQFASLRVNILKSRIKAALLRWCLQRFIVTDEGYCRKSLLKLIKLRLYRNFVNSLLVWIHVSNDEVGCKSGEDLHLRSRSILRLGSDVYIVYWRKSQNSILIDKWVLQCIFWYTSSSSPWIIANICFKTTFKKR